MANASPTVHQRELGLRLRKLRTALGLTVEDAAEKLLCSATKISRMEAGARRPALRDVRMLCALYNVNEPVSAELMKLTREAREQHWWTQYEDLKLSSYIGLEQDASSITAYSMYHVHGLAQMEDHVREIVKAVAPKIDSAVHQQRVEARLRRQERLGGKNPPRYRALLDEAVLHRQVSSPVLMTTQLSKIATLGSSGKLVVQIIPFEFGVYSAPDISFTLLECSKPLLTRVLFIEGLSGSQHHERTVDVACYRERIEYIRDSALSPRDSVLRLSNMRKTYAAE